MNEQRPTVDLDWLDRTVRQVLAEIAPEADLVELDPAAPLQETLDLDSMDFLTFVTEVHEATGVDIPERDYADVATLAGCTAYLATRLE